MTLLVVWSAWEVITDARRAVHGGVPDPCRASSTARSAALDGILFYVFFEAMLIPMYLIIGVWGGPNRVYAAVKFFLYTLLGSLLMLVALIYLYRRVRARSRSSSGTSVPLSLKTQMLLFVAFFLAFAVKVPMWPVHTWLPDAHVEAPTGGSVDPGGDHAEDRRVRFRRASSCRSCPTRRRYLPGFVITLSLIAVVYIGFVALVQADMKKLIAYSSISHMGFVTLGFFLFSQLGVEGGLAQMISHGFVSAAMFLCVGVMYDRMHSRLIADYGGVVNTMPKFAAFMMLFAMANAGLPATSGLRRRVPGDPGGGQGQLLAGLRSPRRSMILGAAYTLWMYKRVIYGAVAQRPRRRADGPQPPRVLAAGARSRCSCCCDGRLAEAVHRRDARLGRRPARARRAEQALTRGAR